MAGPLDGVRVLDLSRVLAGPWSTQILADLGADVIKVERKGLGDDTRRWGPPYLTDKDGQATHESGYFLSANRGKRSLEIDFSDPKDVETIKQLVLDSDILVENFKVGTMERFGLSYPELNAINPKLIYCSITGFGTTGPRKDQVAYDFMIQAMGGLMSVTGEADDKPGGGPQKIGVPIVDIMTGMYSTIGILGALAGRARTGQGEKIDIGMLDVCVATLANQAMNFLISEEPPKRRGNRHPNIQPQDVFATSDGYIVLAVGNDEQFKRFCQAIECPELASDPRFEANHLRVTNLSELHTLISQALASKPLAHWLETLDAHGVPCGPINTVPMVFQEEQVKHRKMLQHLAHPLTETLPQVVSPIRYENQPLVFEVPPPLLGQHNAEILNQLGKGKKND